MGAARVREIFSRAKSQSPAIVFIDEIDAVAKSRGDGRLKGVGNDEREQTLNQLLTELDGFESLQLPASARVASSSLSLLAGQPAQVPPPVLICHGCRVTAPLKTTVPRHTKDARPLMGRSDCPCAPRCALPTARAHLAAPSRLPVHTSLRPPDCPCAPCCALPTARAHLAAPSRLPVRTLLRPPDCPCAPRCALPTARAHLAAPSRLLRPAKWPPGGGVQAITPRACFRQVSPRDPGQ
ncbi:hypothetical protein CYMTET_36050 [Cymbomonas tetramitiformis]|uniref:ATPase AAA-type core domain-containing protein n=1 Tax=Cymbomonas tetramitiformis TaxID=36881 RepID=A0AAE0KMX7_9CHLO|nr:hypothetical protein CYMTET_36050 [Cymbomonas tetramitiformis]